MLDQFATVVKSWISRSLKTPKFLKLSKPLQVKRKHQCRVQKWGCCPKEEGFFREFEPKEERPSEVLNVCQFSIFSRNSNSYYNGLNANMEGINENIRTSTDKLWVFQKQEFHLERKPKLRNSGNIFFYAINPYQKIFHRISISENIWEQH